MARMCSTVAILEALVVWCGGCCFPSLQDTSWVTRWVRSVRFFANVWFPMIAYFLGHYSLHCFLNKPCEHLWTWLKSAATAKEWPPLNLTFLLCFKTFYKTTPIPHIIFPTISHTRSNDSLPKTKASHVLSTSNFSTNNHYQKLTTSLL